MSKNKIEYKSVRITASNGCIVMQKLLDISLNNEAQDGWELFAIFPHSCANSDNCVVAIFKREVPA